MVYNFSAGPAILPPTVIQEVKNEFDDFCGTGCSIVEISHRSPEFLSTIGDAVSACRALMSIPDNYEILFMQGGATAQFSAVIYNLLCDKNQRIDYLITGAWSQKAFDESKRLGVEGNIVFNTKSTGHTGQIARVSEMKFSSNPAFIYYCDNETIHGVEFPSDFSTQIREMVGDVPIVCDMSSNILSRPVNVSNFGVIFAGAQKNIGPAGVTIVIIRKDLIPENSVNNPLIPPLMLDYKTFMDSKSLYNTPPTFPIYVSGLVFKWILESGGLEEISKKNSLKASKLYKTIQAGNFYKCPVKQEYQSRMNIPFRIWNNGKVNQDLEEEFLGICEKSGLVGLAGHRSVGGIRASLYNAMSIDGVDALIKIMNAFQAEKTLL